MSPELKALEEARIHLEALQAGSTHYTLNDIALTHVESAIGALEDRDRIEKNKPKEGAS